MPLSTFSSEIDAASTQKGRRALWCLIGLLLLIGVSLEGIGREFSHISRIQNRVVSDYSAALRMKPTAADDKPTLLLLGNSLALEGINFPEFQRSVANDYQANRFIVEQTSYQDWYYGLRKLFRAGARRKVVLLCLSTHHLAVDGVRWGYFAHFLMDLRDLPSVVRVERLDPTTASTYFFANLSSWIGTKTEIRNWLLVKTLPDIVKFGNLFPDLPPAPPDDVMKVISAKRFREIQEICRRYGAKPVLLVPPNLDMHDPIGIVMEEGRKAGVPVLVPYRPGEMQRNYFRDGYHLTDEGALLFTPRLVEQLHQMSGTVTQ